MPEIRIECRTPVCSDLGDSCDVDRPKLVLLRSITGSPRLTRFSALNASRRNSPDHRSVSAELLRQRQADVDESRSAERIPRQVPVLSRCRNGEVGDAENAGQVFRVAPAALLDAVGRRVRPIAAVAVGVEVAARERRAVGHVQRRAGLEDGGPGELPAAEDRPRHLRAVLEERQLPQSDERQLVGDVVAGRPRARRRYPRRPGTPWRRRRCRRRSWPCRTCTRPAAGSPAGSSASAAASRRDSPSGTSTSPC